MQHTANKKKQSFLIPEGYLETLPGRIMERIDAESAVKPSAKRPSRARIINMYMRYAAGVAAAVAFFVMLSQSNVAQMQDNSGQAPTETKLASASDMLYDYMMLEDQVEYDYENVEE